MKMFCKMLCPLWQYKDTVPQQMLPFLRGNLTLLVIKVEDNPYLTDIHNYLSDRITNYNKYKFSPHITIGYIKKGTGGKYCRDLRLEINDIDTITLSTGDL